jgi:hypothetical protein
MIHKARGHGGKKIWYDRGRSRSDGRRWRHYHLVSLSLIVCSEGSLYRLIVGPWTMAFRFRGTKGGRGK